MATTASFDESAKIPSEVNSEGFLTGTTIDLHTSMQERMATFLTSIYTGRTVVVHPNVAQELMALGTTQFTVVGIAGLRRNVGTTEMMQHWFFLQER